MSTSFQRWIVPAFVGLCLIAGGSVQGAWNVALLQLLALAILGWSIFGKQESGDASKGRGPMWLVLAALLMIGAQLIPLPAALWTRLPGRQFVVHGFEALGMAMPMMPLSLAPATTLATAFALLVPTAVYVAMVRQRAYGEARLVLAVGVAALAGTLLGLVQVGGGGFYLYPASSFGVAGGFFANANHMGLLLVMTVPLVAGIAVDRWRITRNRSRRWMSLALVVGAAGVFAVAMLTNGSLAILAFTPAVLLASLLLPSWEGREGLKRLAVGALVASAVGAVVALAFLPGHLSVSDQASISTRAEFWVKSASVARDAFPAGTGIGTFEQVYPRYEDPNVVDKFYVNHAHNDYLETVVEAGLAGIVLILLFIGWWGRTAWSLWTRNGNSAIARGAVIASAAALAHSVVDFPLRTPALAALFAACCALMVLPKSPRSEKGERRKSRHVSVR